jgi:hypothetical protein
LHLKIPAFAGMTFDNEEERKKMAALSATGLIGSLTSAAGLIKTLDSTFRTVQNFAGDSDDARRESLRAQQDLALKQLRAQQTLGEANAAEQAALDRQKFSADAASADADRRAALRRAMARQRAQFGAQGLSADDGSGEAVLLGMFDESEQEKAKRDQLDNLRFQALDQDLEQQRKINVLQRAQLKERQNLERLAEGF